MFYELEVQVENVSRERADELLLNDVTVAWCGRQCVAMLEVEASYPQEASKEAIAQLRRLGLEPQGFCADLVNRSEIARRVGVSKPTANSYTNSLTFPAPIGHLRGPVWDWGDVYQWLRSNQKYSEETEYLTFEQKMIATRDFCAPENIMARSIAVESDSPWRSPDGATMSIPKTSASNEWRYLNA